VLCHGSWEDDVGERGGGVQLAVQFGVQKAADLKWKMLCRCVVAAAQRKKQAREGGG
jgi:hypothetical protein